MVYCSFCFDDSLNKYILSDTEEPFCNTRCIERYNDEQKYTKNLKHIPLKDKNNKIISINIGVKHD